MLRYCDDKKISSDTTVKQYWSDAYCTKWLENGCIIRLDKGISTECLAENALTELTCRAKVLKVLPIESAFEMDDLEYQPAERTTASGLYKMVAYNYHMSVQCALLSCGTLGSADNYLTSPNS